MERIQESHSVLGWNDSWGVLLSWDGTTPGESFYPGMERLQGVILSWDGTTPGESFCHRMERLQSSRSVLEWNDSRGVILSYNGTTPGESFCYGMERFQGSYSVLGWNDSRGSFPPRTNGLQGSHSFLGWNDSRGDHQFWDRTIPGESFCPGIERLKGSHSVPG